MIVEIIEGLAIIGAYGLGRLRRTPRVAKDPKPVCGCTHHLSMHDPTTNQCHATRQVNDYGEPTRFVTCTCRQYVGPKPIDTFFAQKTTLGDVAIRKVQG